MSSLRRSETPAARGGVSGPGAGGRTLLEALEHGTVPSGYVRHRFGMYDDDGELYYRGRMLMPEDEEGDEDHLTAPLLDVGAPKAGWTVIRWHDKSNWTCG